MHLLCEDLLHSMQESRKHGIYDAEMKRKALILLALSALLLGSCDMEEGNYDRWAEDSVNGSVQQYNAIVTVKQDPDGTVFFQVDDDTRLYPQYYPVTYSGIVRIICNLRVDTDTGKCQVLWMDYLDQGTSVKGPMTQDVTDDGLDVIDDWMTTVEDGFLTVHYNASWGYSGVPHLLFANAEDSEDPYSVRLIHSANGDEPLEEADAIVYFDLNEILPDTEGDYKTLTLNWKNSNAENKSRTFQFRTRQ